MINRNYYIEKVKPFIGKKLIKVFTGQRRVGKSILLKLIAEEIKLKEPEANIIFIDKEDYSFDAIKSHKELNDYILQHQSNSAGNYLFIDEVQEISGFEKVLRSYYSKDNFDIYCTGSNAKMFSGELATQLSGRQIIIKVGSLTFKEFCVFHNLPEDNNALLDYIKYGGLPYLVNLPRDYDVRYEYLKNVYSTILLRDVISRNNIRDTRFLNDLLKFIASNIGHLFSANKIVKFLKSQKINKNVALVLNYLSYLEEAYFINLVPRSDVSGKKHFEVGEKYYFEDIGLRNAIVGFNMKDIAGIMENIVFLHLKNNDYSVFVGEHNSREIDFIAEKNNERVYIQVCYLLSEENTIDREFGNLLKIRDNYPKYVVSFERFSAPNTYKGIIHYTLLDFLRKF